MENKMITQETRLQNRQCLLYWAVHHRYKISTLPEPARILLCTRVDDTGDTGTRTIKPLKNPSRIAGNNSCNALKPVQKLCTHSEV